MGSLKLSLEGSQLRAYESHWPVLSCVSLLLLPLRQRGLQFQTRKSTMLIRKSLWAMVLRGLPACVSEALYCSGVRISLACRGEPYMLPVLSFWFKVLSLFLSNTTHGFSVALFCRDLSNISAVQRVGSSDSLRCPCVGQLCDLCLVGCGFRFAAKN